MNKSYPSGLFLMMIEINSYISLKSTLYRSSLCQHLPMLMYLILIITLKGKYYPYLPILSKKTEVQRNNFLRSHSQ